MVVFDLGFCITFTEMIALSHTYRILAFGCQNDDSFINQIEMLFLGLDSALVNSVKIIYSHKI